MGKTLGKLKSNYHAFSGLFTNLWHKHYSLHIFIISGTGNNEGKLQQVLIPTTLSKL